MMELPRITTNQTNPVHLVYRQPSVRPVRCFARDCNDDFPTPGVC